MKAKKSKKCILIGLDGATFGLIKPWAKENKLPTFNKILEEGVHGILRSTIPPTTAVAWPSLYTGKNPGKHGIFYFVKNFKNKKNKLVSREDIKTDCLWDILSRYNRKSIFINCPVTYPPKKIEGIMISGMLTPENKTFVSPASLKEKIEKIADGYIIHTPLSKLPSSDKKALKMMLKELDKRWKVTKYLFENYEWDFFMVVFQIIDKSQHRFWHKKELIKKVYIEIDKILGYFIKQLNENMVLFIVSDHGFTGAQKLVKINKILGRMGYLKIRKVYKTFIDEAKGERGERKLEIFAKIGLTVESILRLLKKLKLEKLRYYAPRFIKSKIPTSNIDVDYENSIAYFGGGFGGNLLAITINKEIINDYDRVEVVEKFREIYIPIPRRRHRGWE